MPSINVTSCLTCFMLKIIFLSQYYHKLVQRAASVVNDCGFHIRNLFDPPQAKRCVVELKAQVNRLEAEVEEQRTTKQVALVENEHLRMEVEALRSTNVANVGAQIGYKEADSECSLLCACK